MLESKNLVQTASNATEKASIMIRDIELISEMREVESLQKTVWKFDDRDIVPFAMLVATRELGAILVGAFDGPSLIGFAYSFVGREGHHLVHHSHMLAVTPSQRNFNIGYRLKLAQRERALAQGINRMTWTFDPLQSLNAHFNFAKLGVIADAYKVNFYGEATSSPLHQIGTGTDRLWVTWLLDSQRVRERLQTKDKSIASMAEIANSTCILRVGPNNLPEKALSFPSPGQKYLSIEIPTDINSIQRARPELTARWRETSRRAFSEAISSGYRIEDFFSLASHDRPRGVYLLRSEQRT